MLFSSMIIPTEVNSHSTYSKFFMYTLNRTRVLLLELSFKSHVTSKREYQQRQDGGTK